MSYAVVAPTAFPHPPQGHAESFHSTTMSRRQLFDTGSNWVIAADERGYFMKTKENSKRIPKAVTQKTQDDAGGAAFYSYDGRGGGTILIPADDEEGMLAVYTGVAMDTRDGIVHCLTENAPRGAPFRVIFDLDMKGCGDTERSRLGEVYACIARTVAAYWPNSLPLPSDAATPAAPYRFFFLRASPTPATPADGKIGVHAYAENLYVTRERDRKSVV